VIAIPAVDLRDSACVQLVGGSYMEERIRLDNPVEVARSWAHFGFARARRDLDAATGRGSNSPSCAPS
jgi:Phosphoribosylformimino-5-aminoimidazole carboxamide ribonucleotide (ProFAR) isomerase